MQLAAAFIANGDIRLARGNTRSSSDTQAQIADLIDTLYQTLERSRSLVAQPPEPPQP